MQYAIGQAGAQSAAAAAGVAPPVSVEEAVIEANQISPVARLAVDAVDGATGVPVIDIAGYLDGTATAAVVEAVGRACEQLGFLVVRGHAVPEHIIDDAVEACRAFFHLPEAEKLRYLPEESWYFRGYEQLGGSALARSLGNQTPPDLCELFRICRFDDPAVAAAAGAAEGLEYFFGPNIWPERPAELRPALLAYYGELERLAERLMAIFALALGLDESFFTSYIDRHITDLCVNYYPPQLRPPEPGQLRRGAHSDYGSMTILYQDEAPGGLQVMTKAGTWADVPHIPGTYVVNLGDLMARWTNDRWVSTLHRVINPERAQADTERISIPFFHQPNYDAVITCLPGCSTEADPPRYEAVTSGDWVRMKTRRQVGAE